VTQRPDASKAGREYDPLYDPTYQAVRTMIGFCQGLFKALPGARYTWSPDLEATQITITGAYPLKAASLNQRPAIVVTRAQAQIMNTSMGSFETQRFDTGNSVYRDLISVGIIFNCVAPTGPEASSLAWFIASNLKALRPLVQRLGPFTQACQDVSVGQYSPPGALLQDGADTAAVAVPVMTTLFIPHKWEVRNPAYVVDDITFSSDTVKRDVT
jgi:hypothetical protein